MHQSHTSTRICVQCGEPIHDLRSGKSRFLVERGRVAGPEHYLHARCGRRFEYTHPLPPGFAWGWLPLEPTARKRVMAAFADVARSLRS